MRDIQVYIRGSKDVGASEFFRGSIYQNISLLEIRDFDLNATYTLEEILRAVEEREELLALLARAEDILIASRHESRRKLADEIRAVLDRR